ncbi:40-residue YVTN family beta-propeller repeat-containing protein [Quadrisphaera granulorum]|uniref:YVTN family beta-propeller protein n=1 Tax=Quadrisphaera granulorum TaxID=317664 RepID=A0A315ZNU2_9ACTN|nr:hypothetical protein [Quadrisphaera granulorum]PWJ47285.1 YVTN family beta-propeller protein [Quadrisphaera granulorum]SZE98856.1 40-residue YVTN family beta-propeller repeat-containing protein [Quadrisphaera granulorum]
MILTNHPRTRRLAFIGAVVLAAGLPAAPALASPPKPSKTPGAPTFTQVARFDVVGDVAEILAATKDGRTVLHTDSGGEQVGFVDISDPATPKASGAVAVGGEPTSVATTDRYALAAVSGPDDVAVIDLASRAVIARVPLSGQPDSIAVSPDGRYAAVAVENERDEDVDDGAMPQDPPGYLAVIDLKGAPTRWKAQQVDLRGLPGLRFPTDPEPEYVTINDRGVAAVTLQENNAVVLVDLKRAKVTGSFSAGAVTQAADLTDDKKVSFTEQLKDARREPDGISWTPQGRLITADEGDYDVDLTKGQYVGGRGWTLFDTRGGVVHTPGSSFEEAIAAAGLYPDGRSDNRGVEAEGTAVGVYARGADTDKNAATRHHHGHGKGHGVPLAFIGAERADAVVVYDISDERKPRLLQVLQTGDAPEGLLALPQRGLFLASGEGDGTISVYATR